MVSRIRSGGGPLHGGGGDGDGGDGGMVGVFIGYADAVLSESIL